MPLGLSEVASREKGSAGVDRAPPEAEVMSSQPAHYAVVGGKGTHLNRRESETGGIGRTAESAPFGGRFGRGRGADNHLKRRTQRRGLFSGVVALIVPLLVFDLRVFDWGAARMADAVVPHFANDAGVSTIRIGVREFMCIGAKPPFDHPHAFLDMGEGGEILCPYCSTRYVYAPSLKATESDPQGAAWQTEAA